MRKILLPAVLMAATAIAPMAFAATKTDGTVKSYDAKTMMLTLDNGTSYKIPKASKMSFKPGEKVTVNWDMKKNVHTATSVMMAK